VGDGGFDRLGGELRITPGTAVDVYVVSREKGLRVRVRKRVGRSADEIGSPSYNVNGVSRG